MERTEGERRSKKGRRQRHDSKWITPAENGDVKASKKGKETDVYRPSGALAPPSVLSATGGKRNMDKTRKQKRKERKQRETYPIPKS